jgi:hypothetical protein
VALALQSVTDDLGRGLGPIIVAAFIETLGGRRNAFNLAVAGWLPCGVIIFGLSFCMRKDEAAVQDRLRRHSHAAAVERRRTGSCGLGDDVLIEGPPSPVVVAARAGDGERSSSGSMGSGVDGARLHEPGGTVFAHVHQRQPSPRPGFADAALSPSTRQQEKQQQDLPVWRRPSPIDSGDCSSGGAPRAHESPRSSSGAGSPVPASPSGTPHIPLLPPPPRLASPPVRSGPGGLPLSRSQSGAGGGDGGL